MSSEDDSRLESVRKRVIEKQKESLKPEDFGELALAIAFTLSFFGSAAVLMPSQASPTGLFTGELDVESPEMQTSQVRNIETVNNQISFVHDTEVYNPNIFRAKLEEVDYQIKLDGQTISKGVKDGSTVIESESDAMIATSHQIDLSGLPNDEIYEELVSGNKMILVEGVMEFQTNGGTVSETFSRSYRLEAR